MLERNVFGVEGKSTQTGVQKRAQKVASLEDMVRDEKQEQMARIDFVDMLKGYIDLENTIQTMHEEGALIHRVWLLVLNRGLLIDFPDEFSVVKAAKNATHHLRQLVFTMLEGIIKIQENGGVHSSKLFLYRTAKPNVVIPNWHNREKYNVLPPIYPYEIMPNEQINRYSRLLTKLNVYVSTIATLTESSCNLFLIYFFYRYRHS